ncbi:MAG: class E sortase [Actinobacteria bacterium]|nr:class E sortase [Actinomycetota bacterium]
MEVAPQTTMAPLAAVETPAVAQPAPAAQPPPAADNPVPVGVDTRPQAKVAAGRKPQPTGRIEIPAIGLNHATYEGIDLSIINHGPSHWPGTARPGERGNTVFPGHRTTYSRPFWDIDRLRAGDHVIFTTPAGRFTYQVREGFVVDERATWITKQTEDATFTIFACHPKGSARQRYVVQGSLLSSATTTTAPNTTTTTAPRNDSLIPGLFG